MHACLHELQLTVSLWLHACAGGVDQVVDWSKTAPRRKQKRPADDAGDFDDQVRLAMQLLRSFTSWPTPPGPASSSIAGQDARVRRTAAEPCACPARSPKGCQ